jgi:hypothetical protein
MHAGRAGRYRTDVGRGTSNAGPSPHTPLPGSKIKNG